MLKRLVLLASALAFAAGRGPSRRASEGQGHAAAQLVHVQRARALLSRQGARLLRPGRHRPRHPGGPRLGRHRAGGRRGHGDVRLRRRADDDQGRRQGRAGHRHRRRAADEPDVGDGLRGQEHPEARGHQGQDGRGHARRLDVAGLAAVPEEDELEGRRFQGRRRRRADQAQRGDERPGRPAARLRDGPGDQAAGREEQGGVSDPLRRLRRQHGELGHHRAEGSAEAEARPRQALHARGDAIARGSGEEPRSCRRRDDQGTAEVGREGHAHSWG